MSSPEPAATTEPPLLQIADLTVDFSTDDGVVHAVAGVDLEVSAGEILAIVGESGSGKSVTALSILQLVQGKRTRTGGGILLKGEDLTQASPARLRQVRGGEVGMIFQDPMTALNPVMTIGAQLVEGIRLHNRQISKADALARSRDLLAVVGVANAEQRLKQYPHEFSGGMRQRAMIAMAISNDPDLIIADEPTTALDVTIQAQVLAQIKKAQTETGAATILITHDLGVVAELADRVAVMYAGRVVETAPVGDLFHQPRHPYTMGLLSSLPSLDSDAQRLHPIPGSPPDVTQDFDACPFVPRCPLAVDACTQGVPPLVTVADNHQAACVRTDDLVGQRPEDVFVRTVVVEDEHGAVENEQGAVEESTAKSGGAA
ncbi:ABC transporter ATP-binding protein [Propionibacteriaceae bacterium Y1700]|uniref:ABC transporter ATP-binding protein n=1 Tax=Microlunatus sp. Y1700 TaxID=3418487 RepID=UPI003DA75967